MKNDDLLQQALIAISLQSKITKENQFNGDTKRKVNDKKEDLRKKTKAARKQKHK